MANAYYVYILLTENGTLYCGFTDDVQRRFEMHCSGKGAKYTRANKPVEILYTKCYANKSDAQKEEWRIKHLSRSEKLKLISENNL